MIRSIEIPIKHKTFSIFTRCFRCGIAFEGSLPLQCKGKRPMYCDKCGDYKNRKYEAIRKREEAVKREDAKNKKTA